MDKKFLIPIVALALVSCAKNETLCPSDSHLSEITFNVAPKTKADDAHGHKSFDSNNMFVSWAYYLAPGKTWPTDVASAELYIDGAKITNTNPTGTDGIWKCAYKNYYWPKGGGSLTFFAYSLNRTNVDFNVVGTSPNSHVDCNVEHGILAILDLEADPNTDFLVADVAANKTQNENEHFVNGVPTLFKHKLSKVAFTVKANSYENKSFTLKSIAFDKIVYYLSYGQVANAYNPGTLKYSPNYTSTVLPITTTKQTVTAEDNYIFIPQTFADDALIVVTYDITTTVPGHPDVVETVVKKVKLNSKFPAGWEPGKKYTVDLTFSLDEITWDPAVQDWENVAAADITIK